MDPFNGQTTSPQVGSLARSAISSGGPALDADPAHRDPMATITIFDGVYALRGRRVEVSWDALFRRFRRPTETPLKEALPLWAPATFFGDDRSHGCSVESVCALVLDFDHDVELAVAIEAFTGIDAFIHTTFRHDARSHRFRVVLPFEHPVAADRYSAIWHGAELFCRSLDLHPDSSCKNASRIWYVPGRRPSKPFDAHRLRGRAWCPDRWSKPREMTPLRAILSDLDWAKVGDGELGRRRRRASAYLSQMPPSISGQRGHAALWNAAIALVRGFELDEREAFDLLKVEFSPRCSPPWSDRELRHKIADALHARMPRGYLAVRSGGRSCR